VYVLWSGGATQSIMVVPATGDMPREVLRSDEIFRFSSLAGPRTKMLARGG